MDAQDHAVPVLQIVAHVLDLVGVNVAHAHGNRHRQVDDHGLLRRGLHDVDHLVAHLQGVFRLRAGEALGAVLKAEVSGVLGGQLLYQAGAVGGDLLDLVLALFKHLLPLGHAGGVVEMDHRAGSALHRLEGSADDVVPALSQHLHRHVLRDHILLDQGAEELVLRLAGGGEAHFDLLKSDLHQHLEKFQLLLQAHGHHQALVSVPQIHAAPGGSLLDVVLLHPPVFVLRGIVVADLILGYIHHVFFLLADILWSGRGRV